MTQTATVTEAPVFSSIDLVTGTVDATTGEVTLGKTFYSGFNNVTADNGDFTNLDFKLPVLISKKLSIALKRNEDLQVFMVANIDDIPAASDDTGTIIPLVRPVIAGPDNGTSFFTIDGGPSMSTTGLFTVPLNWDMQLRFAEAPPRRRSRH